ncbi:MAG: hypothetical protein RJA76_1966 [Bacteroidota bacterium]|jgi:uncharacterized protein (DUF983 family)
MEEQTKLSAVINARCPQCREGRLFKFKFWNVLKFSQMNDHCPVCQLRYEVEPGFWFGAMYVSYALTVGIMVVGGFVIYNFFGDPGALGYVVPITLISLLAVPFNFRIARTVFIHLFSGVDYKPETGSKKD